MKHQIAGLVGKWSLRFAMTTVVVLVLMLVAAQSDWVRATVEAQGTSGTGLPTEGSTSQGTMVQAVFTDQPPTLTEEQRTALQRGLDGSDRAGPSIGPGSPTVAQAAPGAGAPEPIGQPNAPRAANTFTIFRDTTLSALAVGDTLGNVSNTQEPSTGANGKNVFQTGNWYASRSTDNGASWTYVNPYTIFGNHTTGNVSFCCDQVTLYDTIHDRQWWILQYGVGNAGQGGLKIANSSGSDLFNSWCYYNIDATWYGYANATDAGIDYNDLAISKNYLYISSNLFPAAGGQLAGILKLPIDAMLTCSGFNYSRYRDTSHFTFKLVQGAHRTMYFGSNWANTGGWTCTGCANGNAFRVYTWPEAGNVSWKDKSITPFIFYKRNTGQKCSSASGVVTNWCQFSDSRVLGGALSEGVLYFSFNAKQTTNRPFPYTRMVRFRESDRGYLGYWDLFAQWGAMLFLSISPNNDGAIGGSFAYGGGSGTSNYYPSGALLLNDDYTTSQGNVWTNGISYLVTGTGNACTSQGLYRWGDYLTVRPFYPAGYAFIGTSYAIKGNNCGSAGWYSEPHNVIFGRGRDQAEYDRWKLQ